MRAQVNNLIARRRLSVQIKAASQSQLENSPTPADSHPFSAFLGSDSHFQFGIMKSKWGPEDTRRMAKGDLLFRPEQAAMMKAILFQGLATKARSLSQAQKIGSCHVRPE
jgi:hypothetical protein